ncbi:MULTISPECIES: Lrp/AsnC family transcriptional regulator [unclassified Streptomyces]|uniref:Lrp/AsnC family transcriptional regulator n=1 Tax=unclassified Streptomyces TaxID=2593676 RepID=UPI0037F6CEA7
MSADTALDEVDYLLIAALQHAPRAHWREVGAMVGVDATTAARRWARLTGEGLAWLSCHPAPSVAGDVVTAVIEIDCVPGRLHDVCARLVDESPLFTIEYVTGPRQLLLTAVLHSPARLARYVAFRLEAMDGVATVRTHVVTGLHIEGSRWRIGRVRTPPKQLPVPETAPLRELSEADRDLVFLLARDVRQSVQQLARGAGLSPTTVRRRLARLEAGRAITYRCEAVRSVSGWPVYATLWASAPAKDTARVVARLAGMRETRMCLSLSGPQNLLATVGLRTVGDLRTFESALTHRLPELVVHDRSLTLWQLKHAGKILDPDGRVLRAVPVIDDWHTAPTGQAEQDLLHRLRTRAPGTRT